MRQCSLCRKRYEKPALHFPPTKRGLGYLCHSCKSIYNAIHYRKQKLTNPPRVLPFAEQERKILLHALTAARGNMGAAADMLQMVRSTYFRKIDSYRKDGLVSEIEFESLGIIRKELSEFEAKWKRLHRRAKILRRREARQRAFERLLDRAIDISTREIARREPRDAEQKNRDAIKAAQEREAREQSLKQAMRKIS